MRIQRTSNYLRVIFICVLLFAQSGAFAVPRSGSLEANKDAARLNIAEALSKYIGRLESKKLIAKKPLPAPSKYKDVPAQSAYYKDVETVVSKYHLMEISNKKEFFPDRSVTVGQYAIILSRLAALDAGVKINQAELVFAVKRQVLGSFSDGAFKGGRAIKRGEMAAALLKMDGFIAGQKRIALERELEEKQEAERIALQKGRILLGGLIGQVRDAVNSSQSFGGKLTYQQVVGPNSQVEFVGEGLAYDINNLVPSQSSVKNVEGRENWMDAQINYKSILLPDLAGGALQAVFGARGVLLKNDNSNNSLFGIRAGMEYSQSFGQAVSGKLSSGITSKIIGETGASIFGPLSSALDYGIEAAYQLSPDNSVSINYEGDALVFNQSNIRYFNSIMLKSGWKI